MINLLCNYGFQNYFLHYAFIIFISSFFYVGLLTELIFCIPALKIIEWRVDYSIYAGVFLTLSAYWIQYLAYDSFYVSKKIYYY
jgi:hypothetical protein